MFQLHITGAQLRAIVRCAMVGTLAGLLTTQSVAQGAPSAAQQPQNRPQTVAVPDSPQTTEIEVVPTANISLHVADSAQQDTGALPEAPTAQRETAAVLMPPDLKEMMDDAQNAQNAQPTTPQQKRKIHPGWFALSAVGSLAMAMGAYGLTGTKGKALAASFLGVGGGLTGLSLYFAFKQ